MLPSCSQATALSFADFAQNLDMGRRKLERSCIDTILQFFYAFFFLQFVCDFWVIVAHFLAKKIQK